MPEFTRKIPSLSSVWMERMLLFQVLHQFCHQQTSQAAACIPPPPRTARSSPHLQASKTGIARMIQRCYLKKTENRMILREVLQKPTGNLGNQKNQRISTLAAVDPPQNRIRESKAIPTKDSHDDSKNGEITVGHICEITNY